MLVLMYIYTYIYIYVCIYICAYTYRHVYTYIYLSLNGIGIKCAARMMRKCGVFQKEVYEQAIPNTYD